MLLAAICSAIASCMVPFVLQKQPGSEQLATYIWLALVSTFGSWAVLIPAKFAEGKVEDHTPLRISMLLLGTLIGLTAWFLGDSLMLKMPGLREPFDVGRGLISHQMLNWPGTRRWRQSSGSVLRRLLCVPVPRPTLVATNRFHAHLAS